MSSAPTRVLSAATGQVLAGATAALDLVRSARKPLHPRGAVVRATLERTGAAERFGVPWLDESGTDEVTVRVSRSAGLPPGWPDVLGLSIRVEGEATHDLLLDSAGWSPLTRHLPLPARDPLTAGYSTVFPYDGAGGRVVLGARGEPVDGRPVFGLHVARVGGPWQRFGTLRLHARPEDAEDAPLSLDPMQHPLPGLHLPRVVVALREPSYRIARRLRGSRAA